jgi:hypothetical protein
MTDRGFADSVDSVDSEAQVTPSAGAPNATESASVTQWPTESHSCPSTRTSESTEDPESETARSVAYHDAGTPFVLCIDDDGWPVPVPIYGRPGLLHLPHETPTARKTRARLEQERRGFPFVVVSEGDDDQL